MKISFKETEIYFEVSGKGPAIVWLHGFLESKEIWSKQTSYFNSKFTNICIDLLGHGQSACLTQNHSIEIQAKVVEAVLSYLKIQKFAVVGHSMGGYIALSLLNTCKKSISHLVLLNSTSYPDTVERKLNRDRAIKLVKAQKNSFISMGIHNLFTKANRVLYFKEIERLIITAQQMSTQGITLAIEGMKVRNSATAALKTYTGKKLIIAGKQDAIIPMKQSLAESDKVNATIAMVSGGHMSYLEAGEECNKLLLEFLN